MGLLIAVAAVATLITAGLLTRLVIELAGRYQLVDIPNRRSSHGIATPRAGGLAIFASSFVTCALVGLLGYLDHQIVLAVMGGGTAVAAVGFADDRFRIRPATRLIVHLAAATWVVMSIGGVPPLRWSEQLVDLGLTGEIAAVLGIVWVLNLFNFMDGIDGIAASEAVFVCMAGAVLGALYGGSPEATVMAVIVGSASAGFLVWNWPPAKIFMGDVGSGYLGFVIAVLALASAGNNSGMLIAWLILGAVFFVDATVTLIRRLVRGERVYEAHRSHAYQWLARRWGSHVSVTLAVLVTDIVWLLPFAWLSVARPELAVLAAGGAIIPLAVIALLVGAGRSESGQTGPPTKPRQRDGR